MNGSGRMNTGTKIVMIMVMFIIFLIIKIEYGQIGIITENPIMV